MAVTRRRGVVGRRAFLQWTLRSPLSVRTMQAAGAAQPAREGWERETLAVMFCPTASTLPACLLMHYLGPAYINWLRAWE